MKATLLFLALSLNDPTAWKTATSEGVTAELRSDASALRLDFDFHGGAGYAIARRPVELELPGNFEVSFRVRGQGPANNLEIKLVDPSGDNVWWSVRREFRFPETWQPITLKRRHFSFAWGPAGGGEVRKVGAFEIAVSAGDGGKGTLWIEGLEIREIPPDPPKGKPSLADGDPPNEVVRELAREARRGDYPRAWRDEQTYWTVLGTDGGKEEALLSEDGALELHRGGPSVEPFLIDGERRIGWADVRIAQSLADGDLPIPTVRWELDGLSMEVTAFAAAEAEPSRVLARYRVSSSQARRVRLLLAVRPLQVNPPWQFLNVPGGVSPISRLRFDGKKVEIDGGRTVRTVTPGARFTGFPEMGDERREIADPQGMAAGALVYDLDLPAGGFRDVVIDFPLAAQGQVGERSGFDDALAATRRFWRGRLDGVTFAVPPAAEDAVRTLRTAIAHLLIHRDGPALQPGARAYERAWIRDGALISDAFLRLGLDTPVREFTTWYAPFQFASGKVPCCVDRRGADPVSEHDSHGQLIYLIADLYRYTGDRGLVEKLWPHVERTVAYLDTLRQERRTAEYETPAKRIFYGLLPESISHEGYSAKPMHSYWDDFFADKGLRDAVYLAREAGRAETAKKWQAIADEFAQDLQASVRRVIAERRLDFVPGCAELGDFDATSTAIALSPTGAARLLPAEVLRQTFARYLDSARRRARGELDWKDYTPYELRNLGALLRLGQAAEAQELLRFFLADRRPAAWNQWAEVVWKDPRAPKFIGDMPHGWVAAEYLRAFLDLIAYERADGALVLGAGLPDDWIRGEGFTVRGLRTPYGRLDLTVKTEDGGTRYRIGGDLRLPPGGIVLVRGDREQRVERLPADVMLAPYID